MVWAFAPVQDRHAAPAITRALQDLAACGGVDAIVVARGGGSLADLFAFCDETLCRTVALLPVPVISSVGHHTDRTLLDDVAAVSCSTPTHAAEAAVPVDCLAARAALARSAARLGREARRVVAARTSLARSTVRLDRLARRSIVERARALAGLSRAPAAHVARHRARLHQHLRELRASARRERRRRLADHARARRRAVAQGGGRRAGPRPGRAAPAGRQRRARARRRRCASSAAGATSTACSRALAAHDPQRTLERGYALVEDGEGRPVTSAGAAREAPSLTLRLHDGRVPVRPERPVG